jgi:hypothetical protein
MAILVLSSWLKSRSWGLVSWHQSFFFHLMMSLDLAGACIDPASVTTYFLCGSLPSILEPLYTVKISIPCLKRRSLMSDFTFLWSRIINPTLLTCSCRFIFTKAYQVVPCLMISWSLIVPPHLKPIPDFVHLNSLVIYAPLAHLTPLCHLSFQLHHVSQFVGETALAYPWSPCLPLDPVPFALHDCSQLEEMSSWASPLMTSSQDVPDPVCGKTRPQVCFWLVDKLSWLQPCLKLCRFTQALLKLGLARWNMSLLSRVAREPIIVSFQNGWHITQGMQLERKVLCLDSHAATSHI